MEKMVIGVLVVVLVVVIASLWIMWRALKKALQGERMKNAFLLHINHQVREPLKAVMELSDTVAKEDLYLSKDEKRSISEQLVYNAGLVATLMDEVMMFSAAEKEGHQLMLESFSPNALCRRILEANVHSKKYHEGVKINFLRELSDEFFVKSDRHLVELIMNKLVVNACRFTEKGTITIGCNTKERMDCLVLYVSDTGGGIPENRLNNMFTYFEKPDDIKDEVELDLSICHRVAEELGGELYRDDRYEHGTRMVLVLPIQ
jgi:signal transduction histidine kinase